MKLLTALFGLGKEKFDFLLRKIHCGCRLQKNSFWSFFVICFARDDYGQATPELGSAPDCEVVAVPTLSIQMYPPVLSGAANTHVSTSSSQYGAPDFAVMSVVICAVLLSIHRPV
jgi:hypothetical protein